MKILLTGKDGQVGWELQRALAPLGKIWAYDRQGLDLQNAASISKHVQEIKPDLIVNAAAYTAVDKAEEEQEAAFAINATAPGILAEEAKKCGALLVHYSTDYVFDGAAQSPYDETALTGPLNVYGKSKLKGELAVGAVNGKHLILRTSWVYGTRGKNFFLTMLRLGKEKELLKIVDDQIGAPTWSRSIADMTAQMINQTMQPNFCEDWGTYHLTCGGQTSWYGFADAIFKNSQFQKPIKLQEIGSSEYPLPAARPLYSVLSNRKLADVFGLRMPDWQQSLQLCMENK
jgi:dTDP-4-dehydrorhamnose reductase